MTETAPVRRPGLAQKLAYRFYLFTNRWESHAFMEVRRRLFDFILGRRHVALFVFPDVFVEGIEGLALGDHVSINRASNISAGGGVAIGDNVAIGHGTSIISNNHGFSDRAVPIKYQPVTTAPVVIGDNVWIGARSTILAGVSIAPGTVVAAGSVVTRSIEEPDTIVGGVPARRIKSRFDRAAVQAGLRNAR